MWSIKIVPIRKRVLGSGNLYKIPTRSHFIMVISWGTWTSWPSAISVLFCLFKWVLDSPPGKHMVPLFKLIQKGHVSVEAPGEPGFFCSSTALQDTFSFRDSARHQHITVWAVDIIWHWVVVGISEEIHPGKQAGITSSWGLSCAKGESGCPFCGKRGCLCS